MADTATALRVREALTSFSLERRFPEDATSFPPLPGVDLQPTLEALEENRKNLEVEIHTINEETKGEVSSWVKNSKVLQEDIIRSKDIANEIVRQSELPDVSGEVVQGIEEKADFLNREVQYSHQLYGVLGRIQGANELLDQVEESNQQRRVLNSLQLLEKSWTAIDNVGVRKTCRVMKLIDARASRLKASVYDILNHVWGLLIKTDVQGGSITILERSQDEQMGLSDAVVGLQTYKEVDERVEQFWRNLDAAILRPRMDHSQPPKAIKAEGNTLRLDGQSEASVESLLMDLETALSFLARVLPENILPSLSNFLAADLVPRLVQEWMDPAVPSSLQNMNRFQAMIDGATRLHSAAQSLGFGGLQEIEQWISKAPTIWLGKCRETALDTIRANLTNGIGASKQVEKVERRMVSVSEGKELATSGAGAAAETNDWGDDWGDAWDEGGGAEEKQEHATAPTAKAVTTTQPEERGDDGVDAWGWDVDTTEEQSEKPLPRQDETDEDDSADAWGWEDREPAAKTDGGPVSTIPAITQLNEAENKSAGRSRELVLKETYHISSMPDPVLKLLFAILEDGASLTGEATEYTMVANTAPGLFGLPTFALALFRAISPYFYSLTEGGNMYLYNDAMYLAEQLSDYANGWKDRDDLNQRAKVMLRLDNDIKSLQAFGNRSYSNEMNLQKTVLRDLLGGAQSLMQQDDTEASIESGTARIRVMATVWEAILARSVWSQAIGSLADALATKLITDVLEMSSIGQDEAYNIAKLIASATSLDDLFLPSKLAGHEASDDEVPVTSQYAPNWLRLKYLSEVLQSNLNEVRFLWLESELSLYFTVEEVVDLIHASFEDNSRTRDTIREIQAKPRPVVS